MTITYADVDVPPPPRLSFSCDISAMNRMWDDDADLAIWDHSSPLVIVGVSIPVSYWKLNLIQQYRKYAPEQFWLVFSKEDGQKQPLSVIIRQIRSSRKVLDQSIANLARHELGTRFEETFTYRKGGKYYVCQKASSIARLYEKMDVDL
ncbi:hypothetical protein PYCCODRAFT_1379449 [Trametes coccinea BRFM310]|uniref:Uncharacterized protein n=1 Tax=Trametes coccinea (strain BRFM310) TaxID=1353009 RepID=A0A1Y2I589_TRAC3|nr:hypothetical protein PYCCODRAFT_1379449 [Trametes coccinea BRFM310]